MPPLRRRHAPRARPLPLHRLRVARLLLRLSGPRSRASPPRNGARWRHARPPQFRFAAQLARRPRAPASPGPTRPAGPRTSATRAFLMPDHFGDQLAPVPALAAAPPPPRRCALGALVFGNDYRHPFVLAKEAATLDVLSEGRFELSLGAGWMKTDYEEAGLTYDTPAGAGRTLRRGGARAPGAARAPTGPSPSTAPTTRCTGTPPAPPGAAAGTTPDHRRRRQAGALLRRTARRHRQHQRQPARGHGRPRDGTQRVARAHPAEGRLGQGGGRATASTTSSSTP